MKNAALGIGPIVVLLLVALLLQRETRRELPVEPRTGPRSAPIQDDAHQELSELKTSKGLRTVAAEDRQLPVEGVVTRTSPSGDPVVGAEIQLTRGRRDGTQRNLIRAFSGSDGRFSVLVPYGVAFDLAATGPSGDRGSVSPVFGGDDMNVVLRPDRSLSIHVLLGHDRRVVEGAHVAVYPATDRSTALHFGASDAEGTVQFDGVTPQALIVRATHARYGSLTRRVVPEVVASGVAEITFAEGLVRRGIVRDASTGAPIAGATVEYGRQEVVTTDAAGGFTIGPSSRNDEALDVQASMSGFAPSTRRVIMSEAEGQKLVVFELAKGAAVRGVVEHADGTRVANCRVHLTGKYAHTEFSASYYRRETSTDMLGEFEFRGVAVPGTVLVQAEHMSDRGLDEVRVAADEEAPFVKIVLEQTVSMAGRVHGLDRHPRGTARVDVYREIEGSERKGAISLGSYPVSSSGLFSVDGPASAPIRLVASGSGSISGWRQTRVLGTVVGRRSNTIEFWAPGASEALANGVVVGPGGAPIAGVEVSLSDADGVLSDSRIGRDGAFAFHLDEEAINGAAFLSITDPIARYRDIESLELDKASAVLEIEMERIGAPLSVTGTIELPDGEVVSDAYIAFVDASTGVRFDKLGVPDTNGSFRIAGLADRDYSLQLVDFQGRYRLADELTIRPPMENCVVPVVERQ